MRKATLQNFAGVIEPLLRVAHPVEQLASDCTRAVIQVPAKIGNVRDNEFRCRARSRGAQIGHEIANREIDFMSYCRDDRHINIGNGARDNFFVEFP